MYPKVREGMAAMTGQEWLDSLAAQLRERDLEWVRRRD
jgi:hypothetical protein